MSEDMQAARALRKITKHLKVALYAVLGASCVVAISDVLGIYQLQQLIGGLHAGDEVAQEAYLVGYYQHQALTAGLLQLALTASMLLTLRWVYRAHANARALGADDMSMTPGWAVGWYFVPVLGAYKIYRSMMELARASASPMGWRAAWDDDAGATLQVRAWWLFWGLYLGVYPWAASLFLEAETLEAMQDASLVELGACALAIPMVVTFTALIERICALQEVQARIPSHVRMAPVLGPAVAPAVAPPGAKPQGASRPAAVEAPAERGGDLMAAARASRRKAQA